MLPKRAAIGDGGMDGATKISLMSDIQPSESEREREAEHGLRDSERGKDCVCVCVWRALNVAEKRDIVVWVLSPGSIHRHHPPASSQPIITVIVIVVGGCGCGGGTALRKCALRQCVCVYALALSERCTQLESDFCQHD